MEIPSSSPVYTPLKPTHGGAGAGEYCLERVELFPAKGALEAAPSSEPSSPAAALADDMSSTDCEDALTPPRAPLARSSVIMDTFYEEPLALPVDSAAASNRVGEPGGSDGDARTRGSWGMRSPIAGSRAGASAAATLESSQPRADPPCAASSKELANSPGRPAALHPRGWPDIDLDATIYSEGDDDDETYMTQTQEAGDKRTTQNYLDELLTESLLEALPQPPRALHGRAGP